MWEHLEVCIGKKIRCSPDFWRNLLIIYFWNFEQVHRLFTFCYKVTIVLYIGIRKFTKARYKTTYWVTLIQSMLPHTNSLRYILVLFSHLQVGVQSVVLIKILVYFSSPPWYLPVHFMLLWLVNTSDGVVNSTNYKYPHYITSYIFPSLLFSSIQLFSSAPRCQSSCLKVRKYISDI